MARGLYNKYSLLKVFGPEPRIGEDFIMPVPISRVICQGKASSEYPTFKALAKGTVTTLPFHDINIAITKIIREKIGRRFSRIVPGRFANGIAFLSLQY